jgi:hypothetical protein
MGGLPPPLSGNVWGPLEIGASFAFHAMATVSRFPKAALAIVNLPGVESIEREGDLWVCHLLWGWTSEALGGGGTVIDSNLATIRAHVKGAYQLPPVPAPAAPAAPELPAFVTRKQQQQQPQQAPAPAAPAPLVAPGPLSRIVAPLGLPARAASLLARFGLTLDGLLTAADSNPKIGKGAAEAFGVILHHLPARSLRAAVYGSSASTAPRRKLTGLQELARINGMEALAKGHNGCPWASKGCVDGCLNWSGHGGISAMVANCRARRTMAAIYDPEAYAVAVLWALGRAYRQAQAKGLPLAYRLRGTDDSPWHWQRFAISPQEALIFSRRFGLPLIPGNGITVPEALQLAAPGTLKPYEYSKAPVDGPLGLLAQRAAGIDTTASLAADRPGGAAAALEAIAAGFRLAVPVALTKGQPLPAVLWLASSASPEDLPVKLLCVDGDQSDNRWLDPQGPQPYGFDGVAVILRTKISKGRGQASEAFSLRPTIGQWQPLAGGGQALLGADRCH